MWKLWYKKYDRLYLIFISLLCDSYFIEWKRYIQDVSRRIYVRKRWFKTWVVRLEHKSCSLCTVTDNLNPLVTIVFCLVYQCALFVYHLLQHINYLTLSIELMHYLDSLIHILSSSATCPLIMLLLINSSSGHGYKWQTKLK